MMNNPHTLFNVDFKPFTTTSGILSIKHMSDKQRDDYDEKCKKYYAAQENMIDIMEPVIITGSNNKNRLNAMIANALVEPTYIPVSIQLNGPQSIYDEPINFSPIQDCKYPPSQLIMALVHRLK